jgi:hypothetical protein
VSLVIKLSESRRIRMLHLEMHIVSFRVGSCVATLFTDVDLVPPLFVCIIVSNTMYFEGVRLEGTSLSKRLVTMIAFVRSYSCNRNRNEREKLASFSWSLEIHK